MVQILIDLRQRKLGLQQNELAAKLGVKPSTLSKIESGDQKPRLKLIRRMAEVYQEPLTAIIDAVNPPKKKRSLRRERRVSA